MITDAALRRPIGQLGLRDFNAERLDVIHTGRNRDDLGQVAFQAVGEIVYQSASGTAQAADTRGVDERGGN
ncbi:hypothetical protein [Streptomyces deserti]